MAVAITATEQDVYPPRVLISVTGLTIGDAIEVYRVVGTDRTLVRAASDDDVSDTSFLRIDAEMPFGVPVSYLAVVNGSDEYATASDTYTLTDGKPVVTDAISGLAAEAVILAWDEKRYNRQSSVFRVGGRNVVVSDDWGQFEGTIEFVTETTSQRDNLFETLRDATEGVVQVRGPGTYNGKTYDGVDAFVSVVGAGDRRFSQDGSDQRRIISVDAVEVDGWAPALEARGFTLEDIEAFYPEDPTTVGSYTFTSTTESWTTTNGTLARVATPSDTGDGSLRNTPTGAASTDARLRGPITGIAISANTRYTLQIRVMNPLGWTDTFGNTVYGIWYTSGSVQISQTGFHHGGLQPGVWRTMGVTAVSPATAAYIRPNFTQNATLSTITASQLTYIDYVTVETGTALQDLSDDFATLLDIAQADFS